MTYTKSLMVFLFFFSHLVYGTDEEKKVLKQGDECHFSEVFRYEVEGPKDKKSFNSNEYDDYPKLLKNIFLGHPLFSEYQSLEAKKLDEKNKYMSLDDKLAIWSFDNMDTKQCGHDKKNHFLPYICTNQLDENIKKEDYKIQPCSDGKQELVSLLSPDLIDQVEKIFKDAGVSMGDASGGSCPENYSCNKIEKNHVFAYQAYFGKNKNGDYRLSYQDLSNFYKKFGGICLPTHKCEVQLLSENMYIKKKDKCEEHLIEINDDQSNFGAKKCVDPKTNIQIMPSEIVFEINEDNCEVSAKEKYDVDDLFNLFEDDFNDADIDNIKKKINLLTVSPQERMSNFKRYFAGLEWLWVNADSPAIEKRAVLVDEKMNAGKLLPRVFRKTKILRIFSEYLKKQGAYSLFSGIEDKLEKDPLMAQKTLLLNEKLNRDINKLDILSYETILGGRDIFKRVDKYEFLSDNLLFWQLRDNPYYKDSLYYHLHASESLSHWNWDKPLEYEYKNVTPFNFWNPKYELSKKSFFFCTRGSSHFCKSLPVECLPESIFDHSFFKYRKKRFNLKKCITEALYIDGVVDTRPNAKELTKKDNEMVYFGSLVNAVYPKWIRERTKSSKSGEYDFRVKYISEEDLRSNIKRGVSKYNNRNFPELHNDDFSIFKPFADIVTSEDDHSGLFSLFIPTLDEFNEGVIGQCGEKVDPKIFTDIFTTMELSNLVAPGAKDLSKGQINAILKAKKLFEEKNRRELTNQQISDFIFDHLIEMHFTRYQCSYDSSRLLGGAGNLTHFTMNNDRKDSCSLASSKYRRSTKDLSWFGAFLYKFLLPYSIDTRGKTYGNIQDIVSMAEYLYMYHVGLDKGFEKRISCLNKKIKEVEASIESKQDVFLFEEFLGKLQEGKPGDGGLPVISESVKEEVDKGEFSPKTIKALDKTIVSWLPKKCVEDEDDDSSIPKNNKKKKSSRRSSGASSASVAKAPKKKGFDNRKSSFRSKRKFVRLKSISDSVLLTNKVSPKLMSIAKTGALTSGLKKKSSGKGSKNRATVVSVAKKNLARFAKRRNEQLKIFLTARKKGKVQSKIQSRSLDEVFDDLVTPLKTKRSKTPFYTDISNLTNEVNQFDRTQVASLKVEEVTPSSKRQALKSRVKNVKKEALKKVSKVKSKPSEMESVDRKKYKGNNFSKLIKRRNLKDYQSSEEDSLFEKLSKTYMRSLEKLDNSEKKMNLPSFNRNSREEEDEYLK